jgi:hypothetical protein
MRRFLLGSLFISFLGTTASMVGGCSSNTPATPNAYVSAVLQGSADLGTEACGINEASFLEVGASSGGGGIASADDGSSQGGFNVSVSCSVTANSDGSFQVNALASNGSAGAFGIIGKFTSSGVQTGIHATFSGPANADFSEVDCTVAYSSIVEPGAPTGVAAGRVWGTVTCPDAVDPGTSEIGPDGGDVSRTCAATAEFKFQNCSQ